MNLELPTTEQVREQRLRYEARERLRAAAPALLAACEAARLYGNQGETPDGMSVDTMLRAAIAQAKGDERC